jgi:hypothetical protein
MAHVPSTSTTYHLDKENETHLGGDKNQKGFFRRSSQALAL